MRESVPFAQGSEDGVLVVQEIPALMTAACVRRNIAICEDQQRQGLIGFTDHGDHLVPRSRPIDTPDIDLRREMRKGSQNTFNKRTVPAVEVATWIGRIDKAGFHEKDCVHAEWFLKQS